MADMMDIERLTRERDEARASHREMHRRAQRAEAAAAAPQPTADSLQAQSIPRSWWGHFARLVRERDDLAAKLLRADELSTDVAGVARLLMRERDEARTEVERLRRALYDARCALERDHTGLAAALDRVMREVCARSWLLEGRGPYEWDDDRYRDEAGQAMDTVIKIAGDALAATGGLICVAARAIDDVLGYDRLQALHAEARTPPSALQRKEAKGGHHVTGQVTPGPGDGPIPSLDMALAPEKEPTP